MLVSAMHEQNDILGSALGATVVRNDVITNNVANADVPGFKSKRVDFEASLAEALADRKRTGKLDLSNAKPHVRLINEHFNYRVDENNVDVELQMMDLYQNSIKYEALVNSVLNNSKRLNLAIAGR